MSPAPSMPADRVRVSSLVTAALFVTAALLAAVAGPASAAPREPSDDDAPRDGAASAATGHRVVPLRTGVCALGADHVLGDGHAADERLEFAIYAFLIVTSSGEHILYDLGPESLAYSNAMFRRFGFFRDLGEDAPGGERYPDDIRQPEGNVFRQLAARGIRPADVDHVIYSHFHADHHGMDDAEDGGASERFPAATFHGSGRGWRQNLASRRDGSWASYVDFAFSDFLLEAERAGRARMEDDVEVAPGVRTVWLGGHSPCSQALLVRTERGAVVLTSDEVYRYDVLERGIVPALRTSEEGYMRAIDRLIELTAAEDAVLVPNHDPAVAAAHAEHGERWIDALRPLSEHAVRGWRSAHPRAASTDGDGDGDGEPRERDEREAGER